MKLITPSAKSTQYSPAAVSQHRPRSPLTGNRLVPYPVGDEQGNTLFDDAFHEFSCWLITMLKQGLVLPMTTVKEEYERILHQRKEPYFPRILRVSSIRWRLIKTFGQDLIFFRRSKYDGLYVTINDVAFHMNMSLASSYEHRKKHKKVVIEEPENRTEQERCELMFDSIKLLRESIRSSYHYFTTIKKDLSNLTKLNSALYWNCIPLLLKNFVGVLVSSEKHFNVMKRNYQLYDCK
jgi:hypothetical protein